MRLTLCLLGALFSSIAQASPSEGFRAGFRLPVGTGGQRALVPTTGFGVETRLDLGSDDFPINFAFLTTYDEFFVTFEDRTVDLPDGGTVTLPRTQSISYGSFLGVATLRGNLGPILPHADIGAGVVLGFFHGVATPQDAEVFSSEFLLSGSAGAGFSVLVGDKGVIDLSGRYQPLLLNNKTVSRGGNTLLLFDDFFSIGLTAGYLF